MAKRRQPVDRARQAEIRARGQGDRHRLALRAAQRDLNAAEDAAREARGRRDAALRSLRAAGVPWAELARLTGLSRQALHERVPRSPARSSKPSPATVAGTSSQA